MTPIEKLDGVLQLLSNNMQLKPRASDSTIFIILTTKFPELKQDVDLGSQINRILNKLLKDGYAEYVDEKILGRKGVDGEDVFVRNWYVTFEGKLFDAEGGYLEKQRLDKIKSGVIETDLALRNRNDRLLMRGTAFAGIGACALVVWELIKYFWLDRLCK